MNPPQLSPDKTRIFARVLGPYLVIVLATVAARPSDMRELVADFAANPLWCWVSGAFVLLIGLVVVALHQSWHGLSASIVSAIGWLITLKGIALVAFPRAFTSAADAMVGETGWLVTASVFFSLIGVYLTYLGWTPIRHRPPAPRATDSEADVPRAA